MNSHGMSVKELAFMFGVNLRNIYSILNWESWGFPKMGEHHVLHDCRTYYDAPRLYRSEIEDFNNPFYKG
jgi:hypothetical protein